MPKKIKSVEKKMSFEEAVKLAKHKVKISKASIKGTNECGIWDLKKMSKNIQIIETLLEMITSNGCSSVKYECSHFVACKHCDYCKGLIAIEPEEWK